MTRSLAVEWAKYGIVRMQYLDHSQLKALGMLPGLADKFDMAKKVPLKRVGDHQELANLRLI
jgi:hypothetical protein